MRPLQKDDLLRGQLYIKSAKECCIIISLCIMADQFNATKAQLQNAYKLYKEEVSKYVVWDARGVEKAYADFRAVAKRYGKDGIKIVKSKKYKRSYEAMIINTETCCVYIMLRLLRTNFGANYKQLDWFLDKYDEFNKIYGEGKQTPMQTLAHELYEIAGIDVFGNEEKK